MASFQKIVLTAAIVILIIALIFIGLALRAGQKNMSWPPVVGDCPDYWVDTKGSGANCVNVKNLGTCKTKSMNFTTSNFTGSNGTCNKYTWATNCGVSWDGITYGVSDPCDASNNS
jgi:hypothetical protein